MRNKIVRLCALALLLAPMTGCGNSEPSTKENDDMRKAMKGEGVGPMPDDVRKKMDAAMKAHGAPAPSVPAASASGTK